MDDAVFSATAEIRVFAPPGLLVMIDVLRLVDVAPLGAADAEALPTLDEVVRRLESTYDRKRIRGGVAESVRVRVTQGEVDNLLDVRKPRKR